MELLVSDRVQHVDGDFGTIRYIGPVCTSKNQETEWIGIEWDVDESGECRGKHDGAVISNNQTTRYFQCPDGRGSFVKREKLREPKSLVEALQERYEPPQLESYQDINDAGSVATTTGSEKPIQLVGAKKISRKQALDQLERVDLSNFGINCIGQVGSVAPGIQQLVLQSNLFSRWSQVFVLQNQLQSLKELVLTRNRLVFDLKPEFLLPNVEILVLNQTLTTWAEFLKLACHFPAVKQVHLSRNGLDQAINNGDLPNVETLDVSHNGLKWDQISSMFGTLPTLKDLNVEGNEIEKIQAPKDDEFTCLENIYLSGNCIQDWKSIDALNQFPKLVSIRMNKVPLTNIMSPGEVRQILISRIKNLCVFNGSAVRSRERSDAEKMYFKRILQELAVSPDEPQIVYYAHPRYDELKALYEKDIGLGTGSIFSAAGGSTLAQNMITVEIISMAIDSIDMKPLKKKLPLRMTIAQLKVMISKRFDLSPEYQTLAYRTDPKGLPVPLDDNNCELGYLGLQDNSQILVNSTC